MLPFTVSTVPSYITFKDVPGMTLTVCLDNWGAKDQTLSNPWSVLHQHVFIQNVIFLIVTFLFNFHLTWNRPMSISHNVVKSYFFVHFKLKMYVLCGFSAHKRRVSDWTLRQPLVFCSRLFLRDQQCLSQRNMFRFCGRRWVTDEQWLGHVKVITHRLHRIKRVHNGPCFCLKDNDTNKKNKIARRSEQAS